MQRMNGKEDRGSTTKKEIRYVLSRDRKEKKQWGKKSTLCLNSGTYF